MAKDRFGDIKIESGTPTPGEIADVPLGQGDETGEQQASSHGQLSPDAPGQSRSKRSRSGAKFQLPVPSARVVAWFLVIPLLALVYGVGSYFLVPLSVKSVLMPKMSRSIDRSIDVGRIIFSPFSLELLVDDVIVGPILGDVSGKNLFASEKGRLRFSLDQVFQGKLLCKQVEIDGVSMNVTREKDTTFDLGIISSIFQPQSLNQQAGFWPSWFYVDEIKISKGEVTVDDQVTNKLFTLEQIQFYLPSAETRYQDKSAIPKLSAVIDSSPFEINAVRLRSQTGVWSTGFSFEFRSVLLHKFQKMLPFPDTGFELSDGEADMALDFILPEIQQGSEGIVVEGETSLKNIQWHDPETGAVLKLPDGKVIYRVVPSEKLFQLVNVEFNKPELILQGKAGVAPQTYIHAIIKRILHSEDTLEVKNFQMKNGLLVMAYDKKTGKETVLNDVSLGLSDFTTSGSGKNLASTGTSSKYTFQARDNAAKPAGEIYSEGELTADSTLKGNLKATGFDMNRYSSLIPALKFDIKKGIADFSFYYEYRGKPGTEKASRTGPNKIYSGVLTARNVELVKGKSKALSGDKVSCKKFHFDMKSKTIVCEQLVLNKGVVYASRILPSIEAKKDKEKSLWNFIANDLKLTDSSLFIPVKEVTGKSKNKNLQIKNVKLEVSGLQAERVTDNVTMSGKVGKKGTLEVRGSYSNVTGQGSLQLSMHAIHLSTLQPYYTSWFVPKVENGLLSADGNLQLPGKEFKGKFQIDGLEAAGKGAGDVKWKRLFADNITLKISPLATQIPELVIQQPKIDPGLSSGDSPVTNFFKLQEDKLPSTVQITKVRIEDGTVGLPEPILFPGYQPQVTAISGTLSFANAEQQSFMFNGKISKRGSFLIYGTGSVQKGLHMYEIDVQDFPLLPFDSFLKKDAGFSAQRVLASWKQKRGVVNDKSISETVITVKNVMPEKSGPNSTVLSMLIDENQTLEMKFADESAGIATQPFLIQQFINRLRHLEVKAAISPGLVLKSALPQLELVHDVIFDPGEAVLKDSKSLAAYAELIQLRPFLMLDLQGSYNSTSDREVIQQRLQAEADQKVEVENKRRALEKVKIMQAEQRRRKKMEAAGPGGVVEEIIPGESKRDLDPLPRVKVVLDESRLTDLARKRSRVLYDYFVNQLRIDSTRVKQSKDVLQGIVGVKIHVLPYRPPGIK